MDVANGTLRQPGGAQSSGKDSMIFSALCYNLSWRTGLSISQFLNERVMSLRVRCPKGCIIYVSMIRGGKVVRCPKCKTMIRISNIPNAERERGRSIECRAEIYEGLDDTGPNPAPGNTQSVQLDSVHRQSQAGLQSEKGKSPSAINPPPKEGGEVRLEVPKPRQQLNASDSNCELPSVAFKVVGGVLETNPPAIHQRQPKTTVGVKAQSDLNMAGDLETVEGTFRGEGDGVSLIKSVKGKPAEANGKQNWEERLIRANADRFFLAKLFATGLVLVAGLNLIPVLIQLTTWSGFFQADEIPNWFFLQLVISLLNLMYAIFLFQINDWSAMRSVSVLMLAMAFIYGGCCTGLLLGGNNGSLMMLLEMSSVAFRRATIGFAVMLCLATLISYWAAKEASNWQRAEKALKHILLNRTR
ncbi:MAG: hypothetical protein ACKVHR_02610 [Pirellulales bacterium]